jgi:hypothetical protein
MKVSPAVQFWFITGLDLITYQLSTFSFAAPLETRGIPLIPVISPRPSQEELQTAMGKLCYFPPQGTYHLQIALKVTSSVHSTFTLCDFPFKKNVCKHLGSQAPSTVSSPERKLLCE